MFDRVVAFLDGAGGILAGLVAAGVFKDRWPVSWLWNRLLVEPARDGLDRAIDDNATVKALDARTDAMYRELHPNGGSSLRDVADRTELRVARVEKHIGIDPP